MARGQLYRVVDYLHRLTVAGNAGAAPDRQLLDRFCRSRDDAAFTGLIQRHGPMVLSVCGRVLGDAHLAEDVFQATFLVLARKAGAIRQLDSLAGWLYRVAYHLAVRVRARDARRRCQDLRESTMADAIERPDLSWREACEILDDELAQLPDKYRLPLVLCYLEGKTNEAAAKELGWPSGSIARRLAKGRELLRRRLVGRGVVFSTGLLTALVPATASAAAVPARLVAVTAQAGVAYAAGSADALSYGLVAPTIAALAEAGLALVGGGKRSAVLLVAMVLAVGGLGVAAYVGRARVPAPPPVSAPAGEPVPAAPVLAAPRILLVIPHEEFWYPDYAAVRRALEGAGARVIVAASSLTPAQPDPSLPGHPVTPDVLLADARAADLDAVVFCSGMDGLREFLANRPAARQSSELIRQMMDEGKSVAAIGMGTVVLADARVLAGRQATGHDQVREKAINLGARWTPLLVVRDGPIVTVRDAEAAGEFAAELLRDFRSPKP